MQSDSLVLPLVLRDHEQQEYTLELACAAASPTKLISWGLDVEHEEDMRDTSAAGAAMGCEDGSILLFSVNVVVEDVAQLAPVSSGKHGVSLSHATLPSHVSRESSPSPSSASSHKFPTHSRNTSASIHMPHPLSQPTRSRVTSSVSKASAEAPKNFVDYDDEKDKLEGMLKGGPALREKSITDGLRASYGIAGLGITSTKDANGGSQRKNLRLSYNERTSSTSGTPRDSLSSPPSPSSLSSQPSPKHPPPPSELGRLHHVGVAPPLIPRFHVFPRRFGIGNSVASLRRLSSGTLLALQESGIVTVISTQSGLCLASLDMESNPHLQPPPPPSPSEFLDATSDQAIWAWKYLHVVETHEGTILLAAASDQASVSDDRDPETRTRVCILQLQKLSSVSESLDSGVTTRYSVLQKVAEWMMGGPPEAVGLIEEDDAPSVKLFYATLSPEPKIMAHSLQVVPSAFVMTAPVSLQPSPDAISSSSVASTAVPTSLPNLLLPIPNPFKPNSKGRNLGKDPKMVATVVPGRVILSPAETMRQSPTLGVNRNATNMRLWSFGEQCVRGALWDSRDFLVFEEQVAKAKTRLETISHHGLTMVEQVEADTVMLVGKRQIDIYRLPYMYETSTSRTSNHRLEHLSSTALTRPCSVATVISPSLLLCSEMKVNSTGSKRQRLMYTPVTPVSLKTKQSNKERGDKRKRKTAWSCSFEKPPLKEGGSPRRLTSLLPVEVDLIVLGFSDGSVSRSPLTNLLTTGWPKASGDIPPVNGMITSLHSIKNERNGERLIIGGVDDGGITVWDLSTMQLRAQWTVFTVPLLTVISLEGEDVGRLRDCILCVSDDGTLAVIAVDGLEFLYLIPGSAARLTRICLGEDNLLLMYADEKARLWDIKTQEFWRSMTSKTANELLRQGGWFEAEVGRGETDFGKTPLAPLHGSFSSFDDASTLLLDICALSDLIHPLPASHLFRDPRLPEDTATRTKDSTSSAVPLHNKKLVSRRKKLLQALLGCLVSFGLDEVTDEICRERLAITPSSASVGISSADQTASLLNSSASRDIWQISPEHTASRLLALVTILRGLLVFDECEQYANRVITFYVTALRDTVGPLWQAPSLSFLARYWFHTSSDLRLAARALFGAAAGRLSDNETLSLVEHWQHELPCLQPDAEKQSDYSALALLISGNVAAERYAVLSASTLTDIAKSIALYLHDEACPHRLLAIDLCSRGFQIWQHHVDAMEVLRALFNLSTSAEKDRNAGPQARMAVLQIASTNTPLFMTTLSLDILHPRSVQQRNSIMQLVAFLIRKKPLVLYPNLPRLVEAVVKSLDPASSGDRDAVFDSATEILGQVVKTFPSVDFHMVSQRLCVGTSEGAVIMYDLKTATRLYVLEGHKKRLVGCSFSPDGRRLATVSLEEGLVMVWKVGSSLTSLFMPGVPPRQGHPGSQPFKTLNFNVGDEANMTVAATLDCVHFEWPADRTAKLKIRDSTFTFNT